MKKPVIVLCMLLLIITSISCQRTPAEKNVPPPTETTTSEAPPTEKEEEETDMESFTRNIDENDRSYFFGISPAESWFIPESEWADYKELGIKSLRIHLQKDNDYKYYDKVLSRAADEGIEVMMLVSYESYDSVSEDYDAGWGPIMRFTNQMELLKTLETAIPYFRDRGVTAWEIWNEENGTWHIKPDEYAELLAAVYERCKYTDKWDENATIVMGGLDSVNVWFPKGVNGSAQSWIINFYKSQPYKDFKEKYGHSPFDAVGIHPYNTIDVDENLAVSMNDFDSGIKGTLLNTMDKNGDSGIPVWITELGDQDEDEARNAEKLKLYLETAYNNPRITRFHLFKYTYPNNNYSIVRDDGSRRDSFGAVREVISAKGAGNTP